MNAVWVAIYFALSHVGGARVDGVADFAPYRSYEECLEGAAVIRDDLRKRMPLATIRVECVGTPIRGQA